MKQNLKALALANHIRLERARIKRCIGAGEITVGEVLADVPDEARGLSIADLLAAQERWGTTRTRKFLWRLAIPELRPLGRLTERQRRLLCAALERGGLREAA